MVPATPARSALRRAKSTMRKETSLANIGTRGSRTRDAAFDLRRCHSARRSGLANGSSRSKANRRSRPGARSIAICAASIAIVPEAQDGPDGVDVGALAVLVAHAIADAVLDAEGGEVEALQRAPLRGAVDAQSLPRGDPVGPADAPGQLVEIA